MDKTIKPELEKKEFNCPHCRVFSYQAWGHGASYPKTYNTIKDLYICQCLQCNKLSFWYKGEMVYPDLIMLPEANYDLPEDIKKIYNQAALISKKSPAASAGLLRLAIQKLCVHLGEKGKNLNDDIKNLIEKKSLPEKIEKAFHIVRVIGNEALHPGEIDINDDEEIAFKLFEIVNIIGDYTITQPGKIDKIYNKLPENKRKSLIKL
jgi:hypothetical protein